MTTVEKMFNNAIDYLAELKERDSDEEWNCFWTDIIGMSEKDMEKYGLSRKKYLRAYLNYDAISSYCVEAGGDMQENIGQVEIYETDSMGNTTDNVEWESYPTEEEMLKRVEYINSHKFTWKDI